MRTIKFRGQRLDNGEWVYGSLIKNIIDEDLTVTFIVPYLPCVYEGRDMFTAKMFRTYNSTVSQFTGLFGCKPHQNPYSDEAKQEAYYGDIIRFTDTEGNVHVKELSWNNELQCTMVGEIPYLQLHESGFIQPSKLAFQIIGDIHDNPELLNNG